MSTQLTLESAFSHRRKLFDYIRNGRIGGDVLDLLLPGGEPHNYEKSLWDYKEELPLSPSGHRLSDLEREEYNAKIAGVIKDAVSFYNSYGGYLVIGVKDHPRQITGFSNPFDCDDLNKRIQGATKHDIDCHFAPYSVETPDGVKSVGLLFIPRRPDTIPPAQFLRDAPSYDGRKAYTRQTIYLRRVSECRPAETPEDYTFLCSPGQRQFVDARFVGTNSVLDNNLPPRDPGFIKFIGREDHIKDLWRWLIDGFHPAKLLAGIGGVGKTTLAREFSEELIRHSPMGFERVIWLSAKQQLYTAIRDKYVPATRVDFSDAESLLRALLIELGSKEEMIDPDWNSDDLVNEAIKALTIIPSFLIIDDIDSLIPEQQNAVFHTVLQVIGRTMGRGSAASRGLLTARLNLGASPSQLINVKGLNIVDFSQYVAMTAAEMELKLTASTKQMERFRRITEGSPTFASSILRLLELGDNLNHALDRWQGSDGEEVRKFAFERELNNLSDSQLRTLYALCVLGETSQLELQQITQSSTTLLRDDILELRKYHLLALGGDLPHGGARLVIPGGIRLMRDIIRAKVRDPNRVEKDCARRHAQAPKLAIDVGAHIRRVASLWQNNSPDEALEVAQNADRENPKSGDIKCLLGRAYMRLSTPRPKQAETAFRDANKFHCQRPELLGFWIEAKRMLGDWFGIVQITRKADEEDRNSDFVYIRAEAFNELAARAEAAGSVKVAADYYLEGAKEIEAAFIGGSKPRRKEELVEIRNQFLRRHVKLVDQITADPEQHLDVWLASLQAVDCRCLDKQVIRLGVRRLSSWWHAVERRERYDATSAELMKVQISKLDRVIHVTNMEGPPDAELVEELRRRSQSFSHALTSYSAEIDKLVE